MPVDPIDVAFHPKSIAVVGASRNENTLGYSYVRHLKTYGFKGAVYPVTPKYPEILGYMAYPDITEIPGPVDFLFYRRFKGIEWVWLAAVAGKA